MLLVELRYFIRNILKENYNNLLDEKLQLIAKQLDIKLGQKLGSGVYGVAYKIEPNNVLKITSDEYEISMAQELLGKKKRIFDRYL